MLVNEDVDETVVAFALEAAEADAARSAQPQVALLRIDIHRVKLALW